MRVGIIGAGDVVVIRHLPILRTVFASDIELIGVVTRDSAKEPLVAAAYGRALPRIDSVDGLLRLRPDAVLVAVPPKTTATVVARCLREEIHTYSEKPMADSLIDGLRLRDEARRAGVAYLVGENFQYQKRFSYARRLAARLGSSTRVTVQDHLRRGFRTNPRTDVELVWEHLVHPLSAIRAVTLQQPVEVQATLTHGSDTTTLTMDAMNASELTVSLTLTIWEPTSKDDYVFLCEDGQVSVRHRFDHTSKTYTDVVQVEQAALLLRTFTVPRAKCGIEMCWRRLLTNIRDDADVSSNLEDALRDLQWREAVQLSVTSGRRVPMLSVDWA